MHLFRSASQAKSKYILNEEFTLNSGIIKMLPFQFKTSNFALSWSSLIYWVSCLLSPQWQKPFGGDVNDNVGIF